MKIKTSELQGHAFDWVVAKCEGYLDADPPRVMVDFEYKSGYDPVRLNPMRDVYYKSEYSPSTDWAQGGPIIEREKIALSYDTGRFGWVASFYDGDDVFGGTPLIAAMRCFVASKLGDEVEVPDEIVS